MTDAEFAAKSERLAELAAEQLRASTKPLTEDAIRALPAGSELDAAVAEVMGWRVISTNWRPQATGDHWRDHTAWAAWLADPAHYPYVGRCGDQLLLWPAPKTDAEPWQPSSSIAAAWQVVEKIRLPGGCFGVYVEGAESAPYYVATVYAENGVGIGANADTAPLAICRAALLVATAGVRDEG